MNTNRINAQVTPEGTLELISQAEADRLHSGGHGGLNDVFRRCALAVMSSSILTDDPTEVLDMFPDFKIRLIVRDRGIKLDIRNAPEAAFVDGEILRGVRDLLFAVLRDIVYVNIEIEPAFKHADTPAATTNLIFHILRNARVLKAQREPNLVVCWGGHAISGPEYDYSKKVGYQLGLREFNICTGCGPGAMKGPMKGASVAHAKQRLRSPMHIGITEPQIIAAEPPNAIVTDLVIMPDIEKRLEAFVRAAHGIVVFPGGVGTMEEILYLLGILLHPDNRDMPFPLVFTGPESSRAYWSDVDRFIADTLGAEAQSRYSIVVDSPPDVAMKIKQGIAEVRAFRRKVKDAYYFNWRLSVDDVFQRPFTPTHDAMASLDLGGEQPVHELAASLRCAFSGIVAGNVKEEGIRSIREHGPFEIHGDPALSSQLDGLLSSFIDDGRMRLPGRRYEPCFQMVK